MAGPDCLTDADMGCIERAVGALLVLAIIAGPACAAERLALLIGNESYDAKVGPLKNPRNDVALVGAALRTLKFTVTEIRDADYGTIDKAINRHIQNVRRGLSQGFRPERLVNCRQTHGHYNREETHYQHDFNQREGAARTQGFGPIFPLILAFVVR